MGSFMHADDSAFREDFNAVFKHFGSGLISGSGTNFDLKLAS
jgi:hypothetical protein